MENGFPPRFIEKNLKPKKTSEQVQSVPKKMLLLNLEFKGDIEAEILRRRLSKSLRKTYFTASLRLTFSCKKLFSQNAKDKLSHWATSTCIYQFTCSCGAEYVGRTMRRLEKRAREHYPAWLVKGERKRVNSSVTEHLVNSGH
uniref:GIY-YIG domain-containing protein n=1 Tax=Trichobilharzia regenti TaxID=157069 RepID=A0AA85JTV2_TRIRE|nr:unnamed protein product [Trichobilharzia regenti]